MRVVLDTNIIVSARSGRKARRRYQSLAGRNFTLLTCAAHVDELLSG